MKISARALVRAWHAVRAAGFDLFRPGASGELPKLTNLADEAGDEAVSERVTTIEALRALELQHREQPSNLAKVELVATLPGGMRQVTATRDVVRDLIRSAKLELLVVGFSITDREFRELLVRRGLEGIAITVVGDRTAGDVIDLVRLWPATAAPLVALQDTIADREEHRRMHGKVIVSDRLQALVGSANFSVGGLRGNIELGVRVEGLIAQELCRTIEQLRDEGWLCPVKV
jgi:phosphatidylserine/phosphatidylglycerophosphate/cardiolipin synthase-like enzyme